MFLEVQCPLCLEDGSDVDNSLILLGDDEQNMQCTNCGFASNEKYKGEIGDILENYPDDFIGVCRKVNAEDVEMPTFYDAYVVIQMMETRSGQIQQQTSDNS